MLNSEWPLTVLLSYSSGVQVGFSKNECMKRGGKWGPSSWPDTVLLPAVSYKGSQSQNSSEESQADNESTTALASIRPIATLCAMNKIYTPGVIIRQTIFLRLTLFVRVFPFCLSLFLFFFLYKLNHRDARQALQIDYSLKHLLDYHSRSKQSRGWELSSGLEFHYTLVIGMLACFSPPSWL